MKIPEFTMGLNELKLTYGADFDWKRTNSHEIYVWVRGINKSGDRVTIRYVCRLASSRLDASNPDMVTTVSRMGTIKEISPYGFPNYVRKILETSD